MRALTVRSALAWAIAECFKDVENRSWAPRLEPDEVFAVHAGAARPQWDDVEVVRRRVGRRATVPDEMECGAVVAVARVAKVVTKSRSPWFSGPLGWVLKDVVALRKPVECKGQLGLWNLPPRVERKIRAQLQKLGGASRRKRPRAIP
jgi:hypothetical protein